MATNDHLGRQELTDTFVSNVNLVLVPVTVFDPLGRLVVGLEKENFQLFEGKNKQVVDHVSCEDVPLSLVIILDTSGSMEDYGKLEKAREAVLTFLRMANQQDEALLITVAEKPILKTEFTTSIEEVQNALANTIPDGSTALLDAIYLGIHELRSAKNAKKALLVISDGGDNHSRYSEKDLHRLVKESDVLIYSIGIYDRTFPTREEMLGPMLLSDISDTTGGRLFTLDNVDDMSDIAAKIANELRNQYMVVYRPRMSVRDGKWHKISVRLSLPKGMPRLHVAARKGYYAPAE